MEDLNNFIKNYSKSIKYSFNTFTSDNIDFDNNFVYNRTYIYSIYENDYIKENKKNYHISLIDREFFLLHFMPQLPSPYDDRYRIIKEYADKEYKHGLERYRCLEFEILSRDKENIYAIEDVIKYYFDNSDILDKNLQDKNNLTYSKLKEMLRNLKLVEYKYFQDNEKFEHWSVNPLIYDLMNWVLRDENIQTKYNFIYFSKNSYQMDLLKDTKKKCFSSKEEKYKFDIKNKVNSWRRTTNKLNEYTYMDTTANLSNLYNKKFPDSTEFTSRFNNDNQIHTAYYSYYYPRTREYSQLSINIDLNRDKKQVKNLINETIDKIYELYSTDSARNENIKDYKSKPYSLFQLKISTKGNTSLEDKFFVYDYITYRKEQQSHKNKYESDLKEIDSLDISELDDFNILNNEVKDKYFELCSTNKKQKANKYVISELKKIRNELSLKEVYQELFCIGLPIGKNNQQINSTDTIKDYYQEIKKLIDKSKYCNDFISKN